MSFIIGVVISRPGLLGEPLPVHILVLCPAGINDYLPRVIPNLKAFEPVFSLGKERSGFFDRFVVGQDVERFERRNMAVSQDEVAPHALRSGSWRECAFSLRRR